MNGFRRAVSAAAVTAALGLVGAGGANAFAWATSSSPLTVAGGAGYGNAVSTSYNSGVLQSWLKDTMLDGARTYAQGYGSLGGSTDIRFESGRRSDGENSFARMADKEFKAAAPYGVAQYKYQFNVCMDLPLKIDPCSAGTAWHAGL